MCDRGIGRLSPLVKQHISRLGGTLVYSEEEEEYTQDWDALPPPLFTPIDYPLVLAQHLGGHASGGENKDLPTAEEHARPEPETGGKRELDTTAREEGKEKAEENETREPQRKRAKTENEVPPLSNMLL